LQGKRLSERQACQLVGISTGVLRYQPGDDGNQLLRERLKELAGQHRYGYSMLHNRQRNDGWTNNLKRTYRLYGDEGLTVRNVVARSCQCPSAHRCYDHYNPTRYGAWILCLINLPTGVRSRS
jgi:putative transposase